jgi:hypothetical protein
MCIEKCWNKFCKAVKKIYHNIVKPGAVELFDSTKDLVEKAIDPAEVARVKKKTKTSIKRMKQEAEKQIDEVIANVSEIATEVHKEAKKGLKKMVASVQVRKIPAESKKGKK